MNRRLDEEGKARTEAEVVAGEKLLEIDKLKCVTCLVVCLLVLPRSHARFPCV